MGNDLPNAPLVRRGFEIQLRTGSACDGYRD
jgi:hypothetical protein